MAPPRRVVDALLQRPAAITFAVAGNDAASGRGAEFHPRAEVVTGGAGVAGWLEAGDAAFNGNAVAEGEWGGPGWEGGDGARGLVPEDEGDKAGD